MLTVSYTKTQESVTHRCSIYHSLAGFKFVNIAVIPGYTPGQGGEVAKAEAAVGRLYPGWELVGLVL